MGICCSTDDVDWVAVAEKHDADKAKQQEQQTTTTTAPKNKTTTTAKAALDGFENSPKVTDTFKSLKVPNNADAAKTKAGEKAHHLKNVFAKPIQLLSSYSPPVYPKSKSEEDFIRQAMKNNFVFANMSKREEETLIKAFEKQMVSSNIDIICQGDTGDYFYIIESGVVRFEVNSKVVGHAQSGKSFGELSLLYTSPRAASCIAETDCTLWRLDQKTFRYILQLQTVQADSDKKKIIRGIDFLKDLDDADVTQLAKVLCPRPFLKDEQLVKKGAEGDVFYIINEGKVHITDITVGDAHYEDRMLGPGDYFGERALVTMEPRAANVYGASDGVCWTVDGKTFQNVVGTLNQLLIKAQDKRCLEAIKCIANTDLDSSELSALADLVTDQQYKAGTQICVENKPTFAKLYLVRDGKVQVTSHNHKEFEGTFTKGGFLGEDQLMADNHGDDGDTRIIAKYTMTVLEEGTTLGELSLMEARDVTDTTRIGHDKPRHVSAVDTNIKLESLKRHTILGAGTFGQVWLVTRAGTKNQTPYALKIQSKYELIQNEQAKGVVNEKNIMQKLNNQFIIKMVATFQDTPRLYILLKMIQGGELFSVMHQDDYDGVPESSAQFYAAGILEGLSYMHRRQILYRDLKPENVLIDKDGYPVIIDLGFAKYVPDGKTFTLCGTPLYIAPEVVLNRGHDKGADHWSLGVLVYEMIAGYTPFYEEGMDQITLFKAIIKGDFTFPSSGIMSSKAQSMLLRLLVTDPSRRLGSLARGIKDIFREPFFDSLSFEQYRQRKLKAPWKPEIRDPLDSSNFDSWDHLEDKTKKRDPKLTPKQQEIFKNF